MAFPTAQELKRLAAACRKAGITHFKCDGLEFDLSLEQPKAPKLKKTAQAPSADTVDKAFESDSIDPEGLLFWSAGSIETNQEASE